MIEDRIVPNEEHQSQRVAAPEKQISREIDEVLKNVPRDSDDNMKLSDVIGAGWAGDNCFGPGTVDMLKKMFEKAGGQCE